MKKFLMMLLLATIFVVAVPVMAADGSSPPENHVNLEMFASIAALAGGIMAIMQWLKPALNLSGRYIDFVSWVLGSLLGLIGWYFSLGIFSNIPWYAAIIYGLFAAFTANKGFDVLARNY